MRKLILLRKRLLRDWSNAPAALHNSMNQWYQWIKDSILPSDQFSSHLSLAGKSESMAVMESLLTEMEYQIRVAEQELREKKEEERQAKGGVDYSWLVGSAYQHYTVPELLRMDLEDLCLKIKASECSDVISMFRDALLNKPEPQDIPHVLRAVLTQVLAARGPEESQETGRRGSMASWMMKSLTRLRPSNLRKISPVSSSSIEIEPTAATSATCPDFRAPLPHAWSDPSPTAEERRGQFAQAVRGNVNSNTTATSSVASSPSCDQGEPHTQKQSWVNELPV